jgi:hypothetical protein
MTGGEGEVAAGGTVKKVGAAVGVAGAFLTGAGKTATVLGDMEACAAHRTGQGADEGGVKLKMQIGHDRLTFVVLDYYTRFFTKNQVFFGILWDFLTKSRHFLR